MAKALAVYFWMFNAEMFFSGESKPRLPIRSDDDVPLETGIEKNVKTESLNVVFSLYQVIRRWTRLFRLNFCVAACLYAAKSISQI